MHRTSRRCKASYLSQLHIRCRCPALSVDSRWRSYPQPQTLHKLRIKLGFFSLPNYMRFKISIFRDHLVIAFQIFLTMHFITNGYKCFQRPMRPIQGNKFLEIPSKIFTVICGECDLQFLVGS